MSSHLSKFPSVPQSQPCACHKDFPNLTPSYGVAKAVTCSSRLPELLWLTFECCVKFQIALYWAWRKGSSEPYLNADFILLTPFLLFVAIEIDLDWNRSFSQASMYCTLMHCIPIFRFGDDLLRKFALKKMWTHWPCFTSLYIRFRSRSFGHRQAGCGNQAHPKGTSVACRSGSDSRPHKGATFQRYLLAASKWCVHIKKNNKSK